METIAFMMAVAALCLAMAGCPSRGEDDRNRPLVGVIRWDGCWEGSPYTKVVSPKQWHHVLPFYARIISDNEVEMRADTQGVMDKEIEYAHNAGIDYWAFDYYYKDSKYNLSRELYLKSTRKSDINFCLLVFPGILGPIEQWPATVELLIAQFKEPTYQKVLDNRPLLYVFMVEDTEKFFGSKAKSREGFDLLRQKVKASGLGVPYVVAQVWSAEQGVEAVDDLGYDAVSAYTAIDSSAANQEYPYSALAKANRAYWEACKASGKKFIPIVNTGWDNRPFQKEEFHDIYPLGPNPGPWYTEPTPAEFADHLRSAIKWAQQNQACVEANTVLIYAWNETGEGGRLVPSLEEGAARLDAIQKVLRPREG